MTMPSTDPLENDPVFWRAIVDALGLNPMPSTYSIEKISAEHGVNPKRAYARFLAHFHTAPWWWRQ
jgi:hypothetical protein